MIRRIRRALQPLGACSSGAAAVEFAIVSGVLIMLLIGIVDFGRAFYVRSQISFLADRAARRVLMQPDVTDSELEAELRDEFTAGDPEGLRIELASETAGDTTYRIVTVAFPLTLFVPQLSSGVVTLDVIRRVPSG